MSFTVSWPPRKRHNGSNLVTHEPVGVWTSPGILALVNGKWIHFVPRDAPRDLREPGTSLVGTDRPHIVIRRAEDLSDAET